MVIVWYQSERISLLILLLAVVARFVALERSTNDLADRFQNYQHKPPELRTVLSTSKSPRFLREHRDRKNFEIPQA